MSKQLICAMPLLSLLTGCATTDDDAIGRAIADTGLVAASVALNAPMTPENCELPKYATARDECLRRNRDLKAAKANANQGSSQSDFEDLESYRARRDR